MKKITTTLLSILLLGCVNVPTTTIQVPTEHGVVIIKAPKDSRIAGLKANFEKGTLSLDSYEAKMNPDVIGASAMGQVELIKGYTELANGLGRFGLNMAAKSQGIPLSFPPPPTEQTTLISQEQLNAFIQRRAEELLRARTNAPPVP